MLIWERREILLFNLLVLEIYEGKCCLFYSLQRCRPGYRSLAVMRLWDLFRWDLFRWQVTSWCGKSPFQLLYWPCSCVSCCWQLHPIMCSTGKSFSFSRYRFTNKLMNRKGSRLFETEDVNRSTPQGINFDQMYGIKVNSNSTYETNMRRFLARTESLIFYSVYDRIKKGY